MKTKKPAEEFAITRQNLIAMGERIKVIRKTFQISQKDFAASLKMSACYLSEIEQGKGNNPGHSFFCKIAHTYNVSLNYLILGKGDIFLSRETKNGEADSRLDIDSLDTLEDMIWLLNNSSYFRHIMLGNASDFFVKNEKYIRISLEKSRRKKKKLSTSTSVD